MVFLLDSNAFSDLMRKDPRVEARLAALAPNDEVTICSIVRGEILYGLARLPQGRRRANRTKQATPLFASMGCQLVPEAAGDAHAPRFGAAALGRRQYGTRLIFPGPVRGYVSSDHDRHPQPPPVIVIDGRELTWEEFGRMLLSFEGWQFRLEIVDRTEEA